MIDVYYLSNYDCYIVAEDGYKIRNGVTLERAIKHFIKNPRYTRLTKEMSEKQLVATVTDINQLKELHPELFI